MTQTTTNTTSPAALPADLTERLRDLRDSLLTDLVERDVAVRLALIAALAGEHLLLVGPPGTAKSLVARRLHLAFDHASYFERLLTRFTVPEELFGPLSIKGLEEDRYERLTQAYLPTASIAFLDEIFKANSAILNALLTLLNEREFDNGVRRERAPLIAVIGASNELPENEELDALFDRFLLRLHVGPVSKAGFRALLGLRGESKPAMMCQDGVATALPLTTEEVAAVQQAAQSVQVPDDVLALLTDLREWCTAEHIAVSDRRWRKVVKLLQVSALTNGRWSVSIWDCWLLQHCLWNDPETRVKLYDWYAARVGASAAMDPSRLTKIVVAWEGQLKHDQDSRSHMRDAQGNLLYRGQDGAPTIDPTAQMQAKRDDKELLYLAPHDALVVDPRGYSRHQKISDRTNSGRGFTAAELDKINVSHVHYGSQQFANWSGREVYLSTPANRHLVDTPLQPWLEPTRQKPVYIQQSLQEIGELRAEVDMYRQKLRKHISSLEDEIRAHVWVTPDFAEPASQSLTRTQQEVEVLLTRIDKLRQGFGMLPKDDGSGPKPEIVPPPKADAAFARELVTRSPASKSAPKNVHSQQQIDHIFSNITSLIASRGHWSTYDRDDELSIDTLVDDLGMDQTDWHDVYSDLQDRVPGLPDIYAYKLINNRTIKDVIVYILDACRL